jgi:hypothetical protein
MYEGQIVRRNRSRPGRPTPESRQLSAAIRSRRPASTDSLAHDGKLEIAQRMAGHSNAKTTGLYDRRGDDITLDEVEKIGI